MSEETPAKKIIVDEDWKSQVEAERQQWKAEGKKQETVGQEKMPDPGQEIPPASFTMLVTSLATQAFFALGAIATSPDEQPAVNKPLARHHIDTLGILEQKTAGNLSPEEKKLLEQWLSELRMAYVSTPDPTKSS